MARTNTPRPAPPLGDDLLPVEPLDDLVRAGGGVERLARARNDDPGVAAAVRSYYRARRSGTLTPYAADALAVRLLGMHPALVWGQLWWNASPEHEHITDLPTATDEPPDPPPGPTPGPTRGHRVPTSPAPSPSRA